MFENGVYDDPYPEYDTLARQISHLQNTCRAIIARIDGAWDVPALVAKGPLSVDTRSDVRDYAVDGLNFPGGI